MGDIKCGGIKCGRDKVWERSSVGGIKCRRDIV